MIDMKTYQKLHSNADGSITSIYGRLDDGAMSQSAPPDEEFLLLLPQTILGYNLRQKKWGMYVFSLRGLVNDGFRRS